MIAKYNEKLYRYVANSRQRRIITSQSSKREEDFIKDDEIFYRNVAEEELTDIFDVKFYVGYDAKLPDTPTEWAIENSAIGMLGKKVRLLFTEGYLPDWKVTDKYVCEKCVSVSELSYGKTVYKYKKKDGVISELIEEQMLSPKELIQLAKSLDMLHI